MPSLCDRWVAAKKKFLDSNLRTADVPPEFVMQLSRGADLGPSLKTFEKAEGFEGRKKAIVDVLRAQDEYDRAMSSAVKATSNQAVKNAIETLHKSLLSIWIEVEAATQPPRPSGQMVKYETLRGFNLVGSFKPRFLDIQATKVDVGIEIDKTFDDLIKAGKESLKVEHLGNVAKAAIDKAAAAFVDTIKDLERKIETDHALMDPAKRDAKIKEANDVLKHYAKIVEDNANAAVQNEWNAYLARRQYLKDFRVKCGVKLVLTTIGVGVAVASAAVSFGTLWMNIVAAVKGISDIAQTIKTLGEGIHKTYPKLVEEIQKVDKLNKQREKAIKENKGQKASKALQSGKEFLNAALPITKSMFSSASTIEDRAKQLLGQVAKLEDEADDMVGKLNQLIKQMSSLPVKQMTPAQVKVAKEMDGHVEKLFAEIKKVHDDSQKAGKFGDRALKAVQKLKREDAWTAGLTADATNLGSRAIAVYSLANFCFQCASHGKSLIPI